MRYFTQLPHTADIQIRVFGKTKQELFAHALIAMFLVVKPRLEGTEDHTTVTPNCTESFGAKRVTANEDQENFAVPTSLPVQRTIEVTSIDENNLLVDFLSEALCLSDTYHEAYFKVEIHAFTPIMIRATLFGASVSGFDVAEIKAVTYHELAIEPTAEGWQTDIVFDI